MSRRAEGIYEGCTHDLVHPGSCQKCALSYVALHPVKASQELAALRHLWERVSCYIYFKNNIWTQDNLMIGGDGRKGIQHVMETYKEIDK
jgi:hypothetical protein